MPQLNILISGGGIAGNALAFWLSRLRHNVTVVERFPNLRATGLQIDLRGHGIEVLKRMGLEPDFRAKSVPEQGHQVVDKSGRRWAYFPANKTGKGVQNFTTDYEIMRGDFCHILYDAAVKNHTSYIFGTSIERFEELESSIQVWFANGETDRFDLLVGADGQGSRTRKMMLGKEPDSFFPLSGAHIAYFTIPRPIRKGEDEYIASMYTATHGRGIMVRRSKPDAVQVYLGGNIEDEQLRNVRRGDVAAEKAALTAIFQGAGWETDEILAAMQDSEDFYMERVGLVKMNHWHKGRIALVGDAAYCPSVMTGMGTTCSMVGAYILAGELSNFCSEAKRHSREASCGNDTASATNVNDILAAALSAYESKFRPFMEQVQHGVSGEQSRWDKITSTAFGVVLQNALMGVLSLFRVNVGKMMLKEMVKDWDLPYYVELEDGLQELPNH
jgi:2-polyprenyl-6-methoxyphenol hydroxylase-like FAD-dependent oxidoreductase